jgi:toxin-antitoxin system PIN domain toxin
VTDAAPILLDVNVLVALFDQNHVHHRQAHSWFQANRSDGWATCPTTEHGLIRILSNFSYTSAAQPAERVRRLLALTCAEAKDHAFWPDSLSLRDERMDLSGITHGQLTDSYLLALARDNGGRLATFDVRIRNQPYARLHPDVLIVIPS